MKKTIILFAAFVASFSSFAQDSDNSDNDDSREKFYFGVKAGANLSNVYDTEGEDFKADAKLGFVGGAFISIPIGKYLGVQPEVLFSQKGFQATGKLLGSNYDFKRTTNYLDIPLLLALKPVSFLTILAGPQYSYLLKSTDSFSGATTEAATQQEFKNDNIRKNTLCFLGGLDINIDHLVIGARAGWDIQNNVGDGSSYTPRYKNMWYQATVGLRF